MQHAAHDDAVAGEGADEGVVSSGGNSELQDLLFAVVEQFGVVEDAVTVRDEAVFKTFGAHDDGGVHDGIRLARFHYEQVVRHDVGIGKREFDLLACFYGEFFDVIHQTLRHGADADGGQFGCIAEDARFLGFLFLLAGDDAAFGAGFDIEPELLHDVGGVAGMELRAGLQFGEQGGVADVVLLVEPEGFEQGVRVFLLGGVELLHPFLRGGNDFGGGALTELDAGAMAHAIGGMPQVFEQGGDGLAVDGDGFLQFTTFRGHAVDATVFVVAVRVAHVVLHVADDDVVPVGDVKSTIFAEDGITWAEILVAAHEQAAGFVLGDAAIGLRNFDREFSAGWFAPDAGFFRVASQIVVFDAEEADDVADEEVALHVFGEVRAADDFAGGDGTHFLLE